MNDGFDPVSQDDPFSDDQYPSSLEYLKIDSDGSNMLGVIFKARGIGPHPTAVFLHGFPGYEKNFDLAHVIHRAGWNSVIFYYRGAWGSEGVFSFSNMIEDVHACLDHLRSPEWSDIVDGDRITLIGHSMGGWAAMMAALDDPRILNIGFISGFNLGGLREYLMGGELTRRFVTASFRNLVPPLSGVSPEELVNEILNNGGDWNLVNVVDKLQGVRVLMIGASRDPTANPELHHIPISERIASGSAELRQELIDTDHNYSDNRILLSRIVLDWIRSGI